MLDVVGFWTGIAAPPIIVLLVFATLFFVQDQSVRQPKSADARGGTDVLQPAAAPEQIHLHSE